MPGRRPLPALLAALAIAGGGCSEPAATDAPTGAETPTATGTSPGPLDEDLAARVRELRETVTTARALLAEAAEDGGAGGERAAERAVAALTADDRLTEADVDVAPLFPGPDTSREETVDYGDVLTSTLTAARGSSGPLGSRISQVLSDPIAGDLGIWQRDAEGLLDAVDRAATSASVAAAERAVLDLPGEGTRALAYALLAARADDPGDRAAFAERATAHLDVVVHAVDGALEAAGAAP